MKMQQFVKKVNEIYTYANWKTIKKHLTKNK
jgi:hypothetical protein